MTTSTKTRATAATAPRVDTAAAAAAVEKFDGILSGAKARVAAVVVETYGTDTDDKRDPLAAVRLARRAAVERSGGAKSQGDARMLVLATFDALDKYKGAPVTHVTYVLAARVALDARAASKRARLDKKRALAAQVNDSSESLDTRAAALEVLSGMDAADTAAALATAGKKFAAAALAAKKSNVTFEYAVTALAAAYGMTGEFTVLAEGE